MEKKLYREELTQMEINSHRASLNGEPAVYCGTYGKYNNGDISGMWVDVASFTDYEEFMEFCERVHADEEDVELMFQDYEGFPYSWYSESGMGEEIFDRIKEFAALDNDKREAYEVYLNNHDSEATVEEFEENYQGHYDCPEDFAEQLYFELYEIPAHLENFIDWGAVWRNLDTAGDYFEESGHVFRCC